MFDCFAGIGTGGFLQREGFGVGEDDEDLFSGHGDLIVEVIERNVDREGGRSKLLLSSGIYRKDRR